MSETKIRSVVKSIVWRILGFINGFLVALYFTKNLTESFNISLVGNLSATIIYYFHERIWNRIVWGKINAKK